MQSNSRLVDSKLGLLTKQQYLVLKYRSKGLSQLETARELRTSRANVSMIELRARRKVRRARQTISAYQSVLSSHSVIIDKRARLQEIPSIVLHEGDKYGIHIKSNLVEIIRLVKSIKPSCLGDGKTIRKLKFTFAQSGKLQVS